MKYVLTVLDAEIPDDRYADLERAYSEAVADQSPPGLLESKLLRDSRDPSRWRIETLWESREALAAMRGTGTPRGVLMFREAGVEPTLSVFDVVESLHPRR